MLRALVPLSALLMTGTALHADYTLTILHTNDFHARFEPINEYGNRCAPEDNAEGKCFGGSARLVTAVAEARARAENSILVDGGDQFQGTLFYAYYKGQVAAEMMNKLGYDVMTVGTHEFNDGPEVLAGFIESVDFPVLMSNADTSLEPLLKGKISRTLVIERGGEKLGLIGLTPEKTADLASPGPNITFADPVVAVQSRVDKLTTQGVNKIIVLSHSGYHVDKRVAEWTSGVDVIVGGQSNTYLSNVSDNAAGPYPTMVGDTAIVQAYAFGKFLGELNLVFDEEGELVTASGEPLIMDGQVVEDSATVARVSELAAPLEEIRQKVVAESTGEISGHREDCRTGECAMGVLIADAMLDRVKDQGVQIALQHGGGIRASIDAGQVTMREVLTVLPFQNTLSTFEISGEVLLEALENGVSGVEDGAGAFPQVAGMTFAFDLSAPAGRRISDVKVANEDGFVPLDPDETYLVVSNNFVRDGGDGYDMLEDAENAYDYGPDLADVTAEYMAAHGVYTPYTDGRITQK